MAWPTAVRGRIGSPGPRPRTSSPALRHCASSSNRGVQIARIAGVSPASVSRVLRRAGLHWLDGLEPAPPVRRLRAGASQCTPGAGWDDVHVCIDDHSRVGFAAIPCRRDRRQCHRLPPGRCRLRPPVGRAGHGSDDRQRRRFLMFVAPAFEGALAEPNYNHLRRFRNSCGQHGRHVDPVTGLRVGALARQAAPGTEAAEAAELDLLAARSASTMLPKTVSTTTIACFFVRSATVEAQRVYAGANSNVTLYPAAASTTRFRSHRSRPRSSVTSFLQDALNQRLGPLPHPTLEHLPRRPGGLTPHSRHIISHEATFLSHEATFLSPGRYPGIRWLLVSRKVRRLSFYTPSDPTSTRPTRRARRRASITSSSRYSGSAAVRSYATRRMWRIKASDPLQLQQTGLGGAAEPER